MRSLSAVFTYPSFAWMRLDHLHRGGAAFLVLVVVAILSTILLVRANSS
jgi:uncharacterized membrane protein